MHFHAGELVVYVAETRRANGVPYLVRGEVYKYLGEDMLRGLARIEDQNRALIHCQPEDLRESKFTIHAAEPEASRWDEI